MPIVRPPEQPPYRPPSEADSVLLRVTRGCAWNRCAFCGMYKELSFETRDANDIEQDLEGLRAIYPHARSIFLADSDSLTHPDLERIVTAARRTFPEADRITSYTRLTTLRRLPPEALRDLRAAGLTRIHAGLESGAKRVLKLARKGLHPEQAITSGRRALDAGFELSIYVISGLGGEDLWPEHARESARIVSAIWPHFLRLRSLVLLPGTELYSLQESGQFHPITPLARLRETRLLTELLTPTRAAPADEPAADPPAEPASPPPRELELASDHFSNMVWSRGQVVYGGVNGYLPSDRELLLETLDQAIEIVSGDQQATDPGTLALRGRHLHLYRPAL